MSAAFDSTIAMSAYNVLCTHGRKLELEVLMSRVQQIQHPELDLPQFERALAGLEQRCRITRVGTEVHLVDPMGRVVVNRSHTDLKLGAADGGWQGWIVRDSSGGNNQLRTLDSVLGEVSS